ncbi:MAG TPA: adenylate/guanylate cyclase domain-containing protein [Myxococcaceae bacterium]
MAALRVSWPWALALATIATLLALLAGRLPGVQNAENATYDLRLTSFSPPPGREKDIVILAVDDATVQGLRSNESYARAWGNWPYARSLWARVLAHLETMGARAVVLDFTMDEQSTDPGQDALLREAISQLHLPVAVGYAVNVPSQNGEPLPAVTSQNWTVAHRAPRGRVKSEDPFAPSEGTEAPSTPELVATVLAFPVRSHRPLPDLGVDPPGAPRTMRHPVPPIGPLLDVVPALGLVYPEPDPDGKLRRTRFAYTDGVNDYVTLSVAVAADLLGADALVLTPGTLKLGPRTLAIDGDGSAALDYGGPIGQRFDARSLLAVLDDSVRREHGEAPRLGPDFFRGKVVLIAGFAVGTFDMKATPFDSATVGVVKPATELAALLGGRFITRAPFAVTGALAFLAALASALLLLATRNVWVEGLWPLAAPVLLFLGTGWLLARGKEHVELVVPVLAVSLANLAAVAVNHLSADRERARVKAMFGRYLSPQVVEQLVSQPELPRLAGEQIEVTAFFSDIKGFSTFSERFAQDPQGLVRVLNTYLTRVSGVLLQHGACLDKYIGDAVVCIFGAPLRMDDHARRACAAALDVQAEVERIRTEFVAQGLPDVYTRVGLNTAVMFVGNFGSEQLFNYTAMGDGMNLASRLEGANKPYGSRILIGPRTQALVSDAFETRELDRVRVAGKHEAVAIHELLSRKGELSPRKQEVCALYAAGLALWRAARFAEARAVFARAVETDPEDAPSRALLARCDRHVTSPPPAFDGVVDLDK